MALRPANPQLKIIRDDVDEETAESEVEVDVEGVVYDWFKKTPGAFERGTRKSKDREMLKKETTWTDEQIEGWKSRIDRDSSTLQRLERKYEHQVFQQEALPSSAWRAPKEESGEEERADNQSSQASRGGHHGRGRGQSDGNQSGGRGRERGRGRGRGVERGRAKKDRVRMEYRPDAS